MTTARAETESAAASANRALVLFVVFATVLLSGISLSSITVMFPELQRAFPDTKPADLSWVASVFTIVSAASVLPAAAMADRHGRGRTITAGLVLFAAGAAISGVAPNPGLIIAGRAVQAVGSAACTPAAAALLLSIFPAKRLPFAMGLWSTGIGASNSIGPPLAGLLIAAGGWRWVFLASVPVAVVAALAGRGLDRTPADPSALMPDPMGSLLVAGGVAPIVFALVRSSTWGWTDPRTIGLAAFGFAVLAIFVRRCARHRNPLVDLKMFRLPMFAAGMTGSFSMGATWFCTYWGLVLYVTSAWDWSAIHAGLATSPVPLLAGITGITVNKIASRTGLRVIILVGAALLVLTAVVVWQSIGETPSDLAVVVSSIVMGIASGCVLTPFSTAALLNVPPRRHALATGISLMGQRLATTFGVALAITFFARPDSLEGLHRCIIVTALGSVVVGLFATRIHPRAAAHD